MAGSRIRKRNIQDDPGGFYSAGKKVLHRKKKKKKSLCQRAQKEIERTPIGPNYSHLTNKLLLNYESVILKPKEKIIRQTHSV